MLSASAVYEGEATDKLKDLYLQFHALGRGWHFLKAEERTLIMLLDGERFVLGTANLDDSHVGGDNTALSAAIGGLETGRLLGASTSLVTEDMSLAIPREIFLKLRTAKTVEIQLGAVEWKLKAEHQKCLAELPLGDSAPTRP
ncbi:MAG TPA: hypothetical protein DCK99_22040 [Blastocatellia bacterium]|jgi:hypothetical protein|nr:hypothetical protein [Blastocatellia bacterium]